MIPFSDKLASMISAIEARKYAPAKKIVNLKNLYPANANNNPVSIVMSPPTITCAVIAVVDAVKVLLSAIGAAIAIANDHSSKMN